MTVKIHLPKMVHKDLLSEFPGNSNKQNRHMFKELRQSIKENGFDESLTVVPRDDGNNGYWIVSGNHRFRAGVAEGIEEFPCVIRSDWDEIKQQVELVRRNYVRGDIDRDAFTVAVNSLAEDKALSLDEIREQMGFEDADVFMKFYKDEQTKEDELVRQITDQQRTSAPAIKMIDDLGLVLSAIFEKHGDTVPYSYIIFPTGGKNHMFIAATPAIIKNMQDIAEYCLGQHMDVNIVLGGILAIGKANSQIGKPTAKHDEIKSKGSDLSGDKEF